MVVPTPFQPQELLVSYAAYIDGTPVFVRDVRLTPGSLLADLID